MLRVVLVEPEIPWNAGNVGRTCVAAGAELHLVGRLGFSLSERRLKRAGLDYWDKLALARHETIDAFLAAVRDEDVLAFGADGARSYWEAPYRAGSWLVFGSESSGLPARLRERWRDRLYRVPMEPGARSLNLSTAAALAVYEAKRQMTELPGTPGP